jgi:hypothetical protein
MIYPEDGSSISFQHIGNYLQSYMCHIPEDEKLEQRCHINKICLYFRPWVCFHQSMNIAIFHYSLEDCLLLSVQSDQVSFETYDYSSWLVMYSPILLYLTYHIDVSCLSFLNGQSWLSPLSLSMHILDVSHTYFVAVVHDLLSDGHDNTFTCSYYWHYCIQY